MSAQLQHTVVLPAFPYPIHFDERPSALATVEVNLPINVAPFKCTSTPVCRESSRVVLTSRTLSPPFLCVLRS